ncbi:hypothetical protein [Nucisporomicrobium flavum]|uniref:hypothetical protein n=1 Tax=Nucisporomicrobium flavum TaxID=2785915 RepID=UPI0018F6A36A|nr:hypothetical protein [Nucisporomicrobium flavum]
MTTDHDWSEDIPGSQFRLDIDELGDQFVHAITRYFASSSPNLGGIKIAGGGPVGGTTIRFRGDRLRSSLVVIPEAGRVRGVVLGIGDKSDQVQPWVAAWAWARANYKSTEVFGWWSVISPNAEQEFAPMWKLEDVATIGGVKLVPTATYVNTGAIAFVHNRVAGVPVQLVIASGSVRSYEMRAAVDRASSDLRAVCGLLAVVSETSWTLRSPPAIVPPGFNLDSVDVTGWGVLEDSPEIRETGINAQQLSVPPTADRAYALMQRKPWLAALLSTYQEALELSSRHESFAVIGFVSIVEEIGNRSAGRLPRCDECSAIVESGQRFRKSLERVVPVPLAELMSKYVYDYRSRTAHSGRLHGNETTFGLGSSGGLIGNYKRAAFPTFLYQLRLAATRLLRLELEIGDVER